MPKKNVIIIGAGPAGLTAAYQLIKENPSDYNITILEETSQIGGISRTIEHKGNRMDIGGHRFFSKNDDIMNFWTNILPLQGKPSFDDVKLDRKISVEPNGPDPEVIDQVMLKRTRISRIYHSGKFFDYPISMKMQTFKNMGLFKTLKAGFSYLKSTIIKRSENSLEDFYINRFGKVLYSLFFESYTQKVWGRHPSKISASWGTQRIKKLSITKILLDVCVKKIFPKNKNIFQKNVETSLIEQFMYPKLGPGQLWETIAEKIQKSGATIIKNSFVKNIYCNNYNVIAVSYEQNNVTQQINCDILISSMSLKDLIINIEGVPVPKNIFDIANNLPYRDFMTVGILTKKLKIKNETNIKTLSNIIPDCWIYIQEPDIKMGRIQIFNNWSPYLVSEPEKTVWLGLEYFCDEGDELWNLADKDFCNFAINELVKMDIILEEDVLGYHLEKVKKAYPAYFDSYEQIDNLIEYINKFNNLYCVGRNGQHRYNNMDHSMLTSIFCVDHILGKEIDKTKIWNINTEKKYQE